LELKDYYTKTCYQPGAVAHAYNPSYLGGRDQEVHVLRPAQAKSPRDLIATNKKKKKTEHDGTHLSSQLHGKHK
jgi:hypothetical protein